LVAEAWRRGNRIWAISDPTGGTDEILPDLGTAAGGFHRICGKLVDIREMRFAVAISVFVLRL
jgi:hypothetical protein